MQRLPPQSLPSHFEAVESGLGAEADRLRARRSIASTKQPSRHRRRRRPALRSARNRRQASGPDQVTPSSRGCGEQAELQRRSGRSARPSACHARRCGRSARQSRRSSRRVMTVAAAGGERHARCPCGHAMDRRESRVVVASEALNPGQGVRHRSSTSKFKRRQPLRGQLAAAWTGFSATPAGENWVNDDASRGSCRRRRERQLSRLPGRDRTGSQLRIASPDSAQIRFKSRVVCRRRPDIRGGATAQPVSGSRRSAKKSRSSGAAGVRQNAAFDLACGGSTAQVGETGRPPSRQHRSSGRGRRTPRA